MFAPSKLRGTKINKLLVVRNDKLGDLILALPSFAMLKRALPDTKIVALMPAYTAPIAKLCPFIDRVIIDCTKNGGKSEQKALIAKIKLERFDAAIAFFSNTRNALMLFRSDTPYRLAPATKICQFLYNDRLTQQRSRSIKAEYEYNADLVNHFLSRLKISAEQPEFPLLEIDDQTRQNQLDKLVQSLHISLNKKLVFIHAASGGSVKRLNDSELATLIDLLSNSFDLSIVITAGANEGDIASAVAAKCTYKENIAIYDKNDGLVDFAHSIACADLMICVSSGPLHLAAAFDIPTIGFFPTAKVESATRWKTINSADRHLAISGETIEKIDIKSNFETIKSWLIRLGWRSKPRA